ncbi:MAG: EF-hand domain-containing protein [Acidobacteriota bacterium]
MTKGKIIVGILASVILITWPGLAQRQTDPEAMFERLDQNGDAVVTSDEVPDEQKELFDRLLSRGDRDQDGKLTREEFLAVRERTESRQGQGRRQRGERRFDPERMFQRMDANGDGKITRDEFPEQAPPMLERMDSDGDGAITREELSNFRPGGDRGQGGREQRMNPERMFEQFDANGDGKITEDELPEDAPPLLQRFDRDGDGAVTRDEISPAGRGGRSRPGGSSEVFSFPQAGDSLPDITVYDAQGNPFEMASVKGKPTVLVFGCLT